MARACGIIALFVLMLNMASRGAPGSNAGTKTGRSADSASFEFAPQFHFDEHVIEYFNPKNNEFRRRYFLENSTFIEAAFFSIDKRYYFFGNVVTNFGMGRQPGAILLDPKDVDMAFGPSFEYHANGKIVQCGIDHHCFHQIDVPEWNTLYWNKAYATIGSSNIRRGNYWENLMQTGNADWRARLSWQAGYGFFMHELFGWLDTNALSWGHAYIHEVTLSARWMFFQGNGWGACASMQSQSRIDRRGAWLWKEIVGGEAMTLRGSFGLSLFFNWIVVDQSIIRENRDRLVEVGARVFR